MRNKKCFTLVFVMGGLLLAKYALGEVVENILGDVQTPYEIRLKDMYETKEKYAEWEKTRNIEKAEGVCLYIVEDMIPELNKPNEWQDFFLLKTIPERFYLENVYSQQVGENWKITYAFHNVDEHAEFFYFTQTVDELNVDELIVKGNARKQGEFYVLQSEERNEVYYIKDSFLLHLEGNIAVEKLVFTMEQVISYKIIQLKY